MEIDKRVTAKRILIYSVLILLGTVLYLYLDYINLMLMYDDAYTMRMVQHTFGNIYTITASDVHPPLYYWLLKIYTLVFGSTIFIERTFSTLGMVSMMLLSAFALRKRFGYRISVLFIVLLILFPVSQYLANEIRMYSWASFFTLLSGIFAYDIYKKGYCRDWCLFSVSVLCASYTHYYALLAGFFMFTVLFFLQMRDQRLRLGFVLSSIVVSLLYVPWLINLLTQIKQVKRVFWLDSLSFSDISYHLYYFYSIKKEWLPVNDTMRLALMYGVILIILIQTVLIISSFMKACRKQDNVGRIGLISFVIFLMPILCGFLFSYFYRPIATPRYMACSFGLLVFAIAVALDRSFYNRHLRMLSVIFLLLLGVYGALRYYGSVAYFKSERSAYNKMHVFMTMHQNAESKHILLSEYYETSALSRLQIFYPDDIFYVLMASGWSDRFSPFSFHKVSHGQRFENEFILVQKSHSDGGELAIRFREALEQNYVATDSVSALNMQLYNMRAKTIIMPQSK